jgi:hypothetical protein
MRDTLFDYFAFTGRFFFGKRRAAGGTDAGAQRERDAEDLKS